MIFEKDLTIHHDDNSSFTELSRELNDYQRDSATFALTQTTGFIYIGLYKPFNALYSEFVTPNTNTSIITAGYYNGTDFNTPLPFFIDETNGYSRSGFQKWNKPDDWVASSVNGDTLFWIQLEVDVTTTAMEFRAINILFSNDNELKKELSTVSKYLPPNEISFAPMHSSVRDDIVQSLRNRGKAKSADGDDKLSNLTKWDILDIDEVWTAAKYFALEKIFFQASDSIDDKWSARKKWASQEGNKAFDLIYLSIDTNDNGIAESDEAMKTQVIEVLRI